MEGAGRCQRQSQIEHSYGIEENKDGSGSSICSLRSEHDNWNSFQVNGASGLQFPATFLTLLKNPSKNGCVQDFEAHLFKADNQLIMNMVLYIIDKEKQKDSSQVLGRIDGGNMEFTSIINTKMNNKFKVTIGYDNNHNMAAVAAEAIHVDVDDDQNQNFYVKHVGKHDFTDEDLQFPNNLLKDLSFPDMQKIGFGDLSLPTFCFRIVWPKPGLAQKKINAVIEVIANDQKGESTTTSVTYPVQFNNFGAKSFITRDKKRNRKAIDQLGRIFEEARRMLEEEEVDSIDSIIEFLSDGEHLTADDVQNLSKSKERASELLRHVLNHEEVMPAFLEALRSTGHPQNMKLVGQIKNPPKEETSAGLPKQTAINYRE